MINVRLESVRGLGIFVLSGVLLTVSCQPADDSAAEPGGTEARAPSVEVAYEEQGQGPAVVLIHGTNLDRRMWDHEVEWLSQQARVIRYDLRGHGETGVPTDTFSNYRDLLDLINFLEEDQVDLIGLSAGSEVALDLAAEAPDRVRRLVLVSPSLFGYTPSEMPAFFGELMDALEADDHARANEIMIASPLMAVPEAAQARVRQLVEDNDALWSMDPGLQRALMPPPIEYLEEIQTPTLVLVGDQDLTDIRAQGDLIDQRMPDAQLVVVPGGGHLLNLTSPEAFQAAVSEFLGAPAS